MGINAPQAFIFDLGFEAGEWNDLAYRQQQVAICVARGMTNEQIADKLGVTVSTVVNTLVRINRIIGLTGHDSNHRVKLALWVLHQVNHDPDILFR